MPEKIDFITPKFMQVLQFFLEDPMKESHEREVIKRTGVSKGSANKILRLMSKKGLLTREVKGRMVFYRLDTDNPLSRQFKILLNVFVLEGLVGSMREHSERIVMFGSCSQGTDVKGSDIDIFILSSDKSYVKDRISEYNSKSDRKISPIVVDASGLAGLKREDEPLYENIGRGIVLWERE